MAAASSASPLDSFVLSSLSELIARALAEDVASGDVTTNATVSESSRATARFLAKEDGTLSGLTVATEVFRTIDASIRVEWTAKDGDVVKSGTVFGTAEGSTRSLLVAERLVLNIMQRMSGIASLTARFVSTMSSQHTRLLDTRKTVPGLRYLDKLAVRHGGGVNHRVGLFDMMMIKDNHIEAAGGIAKAVEAGRKFLAAEAAAGRGKQPNGQPILVEVEARTLDEVKEALACGAQVDRIMLDNMVKIGADGAVDTSMLQAAMEIVRAAAVKPQTEASGNVNLRTIADIAKTGVDFISVGALTHSVNAMDISMKIKLQQ